MATNLSHQWSATRVSEDTYRHEAALVASSLVAHLMAGVKSSGQDWVDGNLSIHTERLPKEDESGVDYMLLVANWDVRPELQAPWRHQPMMEAMDMAAEADDA